MLKFFIPVGLIILSAATAPYPQSTADFILLKSPERFTIYNAYEQPLIGAERGSLAAFAPVQVVRLDDMLGDGITPAAKCRFHGSTLYLLTDGRRGFIGDEKKLYHQMLKGCILFDDTVETITAIRLSERHSGQGASWNAARGTVLYRQFQYGEQQCLIAAGAQARYGWCAATSRGSLRRVTRTAAPAPDIPSSVEIQAILAVRIASANTAYRTFFDHFNQATGHLRSAPAWRPAAAAMSWRLNAPYTATRELDESTRYLVRELENLLIGKPFRVLFRDGEISVTPREQE
jgi:hypothetical protein